MNPVLHPQLRSLPQAARRIARARFPQARTASKRTFHNCRTLRSNEPPQDVPGKGVRGDEKKTAETVDAGAGVRGRSAIPSQQASHSSETPQNEDAQPEDVRAQQSPFHGSAARRRQRNLPRKKPPKSNVAPDWFLQHNIHLRSPKDKALQPQIAVLEKQNDGYTSAFELKKLPEEDHMKLLNDLRGKTETIGEIPKSIARKFADVTGGIIYRRRENDGELPATTGSSTSGIPETAADSKAERPGEDIKTPSMNNSSRPRYFLDNAQDDEILLTAGGLMKLHPEGSEAVTELAVQKAHLLLHYPAPEGDAFLDTLVHKIASYLDADLLVLDAQDIAELIVQEDLGHEVSMEARLLSYEIYGKEEEEVPDFPQPAEAFSFNDSDDVEESGKPQEHQFGTPIMIGRPFTLNLSELMRPSRSLQSSSNPNLPRAVRELFGAQQQQGEKPKMRHHIFAPLIEKILSATEHRRKAQRVSTAGSNGVSESNSPESSGDSLLVHVRDLKPIQDTDVGRQFLLELCEQIQHRRMSRERIMLVGTESERDGSIAYDRTRVLEIQKHEAQEISRSIVVTPITPDSASKIALLGDKKRRTAAINLRHLWTMVGHKSDIPLCNLQPGFWTGDFTGEISKSDFDCLREGVWTFGHVHRMATLLLGNEQREPGNQKNDIVVAERVIVASDETKLDWAQESGRGKMTQFMPGGPVIPSNLLSPSENPRLAKIRATATKYEKRLLGGVIEPEKINTTFNDVHAPLETIDALQTLTTLSLLRPDAFKYGVLASDRIPGLLLYGPPGTGKTLLAKAVAKESGATVLEVSAADINDMYVGEGEKNVQALFSLARKLSPCVVFLDEADAMFSARGMSGKRVSHRELLNQFLKEWDGMSNDSGSAFLMVATNRPMDLDDAVLRRLPRRLLVDLPSEKDRLEILKIHLRNEVLGTDVSLKDLATKTPFYSGSDLKNVAVAAALNCVREENELAKNYRGEEPYQHAEKRTLTAKHFTRALEEISASISEDMSSLREIKKFDEQYGDRRGRKKKGGSFGFRNAKEADKVLDTVKVRA